MSLHRLGQRRSKNPLALAILQSSYAVKNEATGLFETNLTKMSIAIQLGHNGLE
jgi:hypothetical protein